MAYPYYGSYMPNYYQPLQNVGNQYQPTQQANQPMQAQSGAGIIWVQGEEAAKAYMVAPGNSVLLMDSEGTTFYLKSSDAQGMPMPLRIFDYTERTAQKPAQAATASTEEYVTRKEFDALAARLDALTAPKQGAKKPAQKEAVNDG